MNQVVESDIGLLPKMNFADRAFLPAEFNKQETRSILQSEDILINLVGAWIGRVALGTPEITGANCNQAVGFVRLDKPTSIRVHNLVLPELESFAEATK